MDAATLTNQAARSIASLAPAITGPDQFATELADIKRAVSRGYFTPDEDERVRARFAQYLTARAGLLQTINDLQPLALASSAADPIDEHSRLRAFVIAYTASALLVQAGRFIVDRYAPDSTVQRKLNEAEPRFGVPCKQFTAVYKSLTDPLNGWRLLKARQFAQANRAEIESLAADPAMKDVLSHLHECEASLHLSKRRFVLARLRYRWHSLRRRRASATQQAMFSLMEMGGRVVADVHNPFHQHRITPVIFAQLESLLQPGDVLISRHDDAMSNLFLPGYWCHAALHIGTQRERAALAVQVDGDRAARCVDPVRSLEAKKDGVLFRPLSESLATDSVAVLRPTLSPSLIREALSRAIQHEGKLYDFEFDFFRSDRLVCTEVVYRAYHGIGGIEFTLTPRAGRPTLAAEELMNMALAGGRGLEPVAVFGPPGAEKAVLSGKDAAKVLGDQKEP